MPDRVISLVTDGYPEPAALDTGISHAVLVAVAESRIGETFRLHVPGVVVAFGRQDVLSPGYAAATAAARAEGFEAIERLAGGRAAVFHEGTLAFSWAIPEPDPRRDVRGRFARLADIMVTAFRRLGVEAAVGEVPGEYCPGAYSVNARGAVKVMGVGQRLMRGAAHVGGVVVVHGAARIRQVLVPVYRELGIDWEASTAGDLATEVPGLTVQEVSAAIAEELGRHHTVRGATLPADVVAEGRRLAASHESPPRTAR